MLKFRKKLNTQGKPCLETALKGKALLTVPQLNKGTSFSERERETFELLGKLPCRIETLEEQTHRVYLQYKAIDSPLARNIYLNRLHNTNQVLFYSLVSQHLAEILPTIYTPVVGSAVEHYSREYRQPRGLYIAYPDRERMHDILKNRTNPDIDLIVSCDGEGVLGLGDQGIGGIDIPVAKLMVYTLCGGINPLNTLPVFLDVGTNNQELLDDPLYLGWRHPRLSGSKYDDFIGQFVETVSEQCPKVYLHWEDFGRDNANRILKEYHHTICSFNDDIQGTGVTALAALMRAVELKDELLSEQRFVIFGGGSAGMGIAQQIHAALVEAGLSAEEAYACFWVVDRAGLLTDGMDTLTEAQKPFARPASEQKKRKPLSLLQVIEAAKPTALIGCSAVAGAFTKKIIRTLQKHCTHPIVLPLSNPSSRTEATPQDLIEWTGGDVFLATGSPFPPVLLNGKSLLTPQCNNALIFPALGLGVIAAKATRVSSGMLMAAATALAKEAPAHTEGTWPRILPPIDEAPRTAKTIARAVAQQAHQEGLATIFSQDNYQTEIEANFWSPHYLPYEPVMS